MADIEATVVVDDLQVEAEAGPGHIPGSVAT